jgi:alanyl-tRNA synthetase
MKWLFLLLCAVCAVSISMLSMIFAMGKLPFAKPAEPTVVAYVPMKAPLTVFSSQKEVVDAMIKDLQLLKQDYENRIAGLKDREKKLEIMEGLKEQMASLQKGFDSVMVEVKESEEANFKRLADIFSKMDSADAASLLQKMESDRAAIILNMIGERQAGAIMNAAVQTPEGSKSAVEWADSIRRLKAKSKGG